MKKLKLQDLNQLYKDADQVDREMFAEMRSNVRLVAGDHYVKRGDNFTARTLGADRSTEASKLRITKNHFHRAHREYTSSLLAFAPGVTILPANEKEIQDQKGAALNKSVWDHVKSKHRIKEKIREWANDYITLGEVCVKIFWDPSAGVLQAYEQDIDDETGEPLFEDDGQPKRGRPVFSGDWAFERVFAFNLLRSPAAKSFRDPRLPWIVRKMVDVGVLKDRYKGDPDKLKMVSSDGQGEEFIVFDAQKQNYDRQKGQVLVKEFYYPVSDECPEGYFYIATEGGILEQGDLPFGLFPLVWAGADEAQTSPRRRSPLKVARPVQAEINRSASQTALAQITTGDDKIVYQKGAKLEQGSLLPGIRGIAVSGAPPTILPGRDGGQHLPYQQFQVQELDKLLYLDSQSAEKVQQLDPYLALQRSVEQAQKFSPYTQPFEQFLIDVVTLVLEIGRHYLPDDIFIAMVGRQEAVNIQEFRTTSPLCYVIKLEPMTDTADQKIGKMLMIEKTLQYVGKQLSKDEVGRMLRASPYGNFEEAFSDLTIDSDNAANDILALDRGDYPPANQHDNHEYLLKRLIHRMKQSDYRMLPHEIQANYQRKKAEHQEVLADQQRKILAAKAEYIPTGGAMIACEMYVPNKVDPTAAPKRVRVPYQALDWLVKQLDAQGQSLERLEEMNQGSLAEMAGMLLQGQQQQVPPGQMSGQAMPPGRVA